MFASKWMKWAVVGTLAAAFPAVAMARVHSHHASKALSTATVKHVKKLSVHHSKSHKLTAKHRSASKLHTSIKKAHRLHTKRHSATKLHSSKKSASALSMTPGLH